MTTPTHFAWFCDDCFAYNGFDRHGCDRCGSTRLHRAEVVVPEPYHTDETDAAAELPRSPIDYNRAFALLAEADANQRAQDVDTATVPVMRMSVRQAS